MDMNAVSDKLSGYNTVSYGELPDLELYMDQVVNYVQKQLELFQNAQTERLITPAILSNSVKSGLIPRPHKKKYEKRHLAALIMACTLKQVFPIQQVEQLLGLFESKDAERFEAFGHLQNEALRRTAESFPKGETSRQEIRERILDLALTANANRLAARMLLLQLYGPDERKSKQENTAK